jgi:hypothetical protein
MDNFISHSDGKATDEFENLELAALLTYVIRES